MTDVVELAALSDQVDAAREHFLEEAEDIDEMKARWEVFISAHQRYRHALAACWLQLEASKHLPGYPEMMGLKGPEE